MSSYTGEYPTKPLKVKPSENNKFVESMTDYAGWLMLDDPERCEHKTYDVWQLLQHIKYLEAQLEEFKNKQ